MSLVEPGFERRNYNNEPIDSFGSDTDYNLLSRDVRVGLKILINGYIPTPCMTSLDPLFKQL